MKDWIPRPYQPLMADFMLKHPRCCMFVPMGFGKTSACLLVADAVITAGLATRILILAPLRVARSTWPDEASKWSQFSHMTVTPIVGTVTERKQALKAPAQVFTINYDNVVWLIETLGDKWPFDMVIADESTQLKSYRTKQGGVRARALGKIAFAKVRRWVNLTGTPAPNGLQDLWGQMWFIDEGQRLGRTFSAFSDRWFRQKPGSDPMHRRIEPMPHAQAEIETLIKDVCLTLDPKDWFTTDEPIVNTLYVELPPAARKAYRDMEHEMFTRIKDREFEAFGAASKSLKCLQLANGALYTGTQEEITADNEEWVEVHDEKIEALRSIVEEHAGAPILVAYHFRSDLSRLQRAMPVSRRLDADPNTIREWNAGKIPLLLAHPASAGHGLNLADGGNVLVFFGHWWALERHLQIIERIGPVRQKHAGHERPVFIYNIIAKNTVDELVIERIATKKSVQELLLQAMKHHKETA